MSWKEYEKFKGELVKGNIETDRVVLIANQMRKALLGAAEGQPKSDHSYRNEANWLTGLLFNTYHLSTFDDLGDEVWQKQTDPGKTMLAHPKDDDFQD